MRSQNGATCDVVTVMANLHVETRENRRQRIRKLHLRWGILYKTLHRINLVEHRRTYISELPQRKMKSYQLTKPEIF